jgi:hypothetical protein
VEVWLGGAACLISERGEGMYSLFVGIDVSKNFFSPAGNPKEMNAFPSFIP